jgi:hypothetical protein
MKKLHTHLLPLLESEEHNAAVNQVKAMDSFIKEMTLSDMRRMVKGRPWGGFHLAAQAMSFLDGNSLSLHRSISLSRLF